VKLYVPGSPACILLEKTPTVMPLVTFGWKLLKSTANGVDPLLSTIVVCPFAWQMTITRSPVVVPVGAVTDSAVPVAAELLLDARTAVSATEGHVQIN
jgi:hypothetical protein